MLHYIVRLLNFSMNKLFFTLLPFLAFISCTKVSDTTIAKTNAAKAPNALQVNQEIVALKSSEGLKLLETYCFACHDPNTKSHDEILAPPLAGIKNRYKKSFNDRSAFISAMSSFIAMPTEEKALMKGPIRRFGLMPKPALSDSAKINILVAYIYDHPIEAPEWFAAHEKEKHGGGNEKP